MMSHNIIVEVYHMNVMSVIKNIFPIFNYMKQGLAHTEYVAVPCICSLVEWILAL